VIMSPGPNIGGTCPPCPIGIDAPDFCQLAPWFVWLPDLWDFSLFSSHVLAVSWSLYLCIFVHFVCETCWRCGQITRAKVGSTLDSQVSEARVGKMWAERWHHSDDLDLHLETFQMANYDLYF